MKILVVEDEKDLNRVITKHLKKNNYSVDSCFDGEQALDYVLYGEYDLIITDIMMPKIDGYELIKQLRVKGNSTPVIMLTAKDSLDDKILGLDSGADDYIVKPFEFDELLARIRVLMRRNYGFATNIIQVDDVVLDISKKQVTRSSESIVLTGKEYEVLEYLFKNKTGIISREQILNHVWDYDYEGVSNIIDVIVKNIRKKLDVGSKKPIIHTKRGLGYFVKED
ncbi:response regulator transcription factor [Gemella morbillorum]|uniref:Response regulator n=1 Tax=Gemella morbillorum TaxID=29391 RepID=A0AAP9HCF4_9BACL|nr:response regulator transcription factor [Gemella morbillorum]EFV35567.1 response regulator receiver domain-containing protein [Gemella morbillorum M424]QGS08827.1 response regulator [Gemella morbillorum]